MSAIGGPNIIEDGLVLYLDAGNRKSYPGSGTTWFDKSGRGNNGTLTNGPTFNTGSLGSIVFDGSNDYVNCGTGSTIQNISSAITLQVIVDGISLSGTYGGLMKTSNSSWNNGFGLYYENLPPNYPKNYTFFINNWSGPAVLRYFIPTENQTTPIVLTGTYSTTTGLRLYINGNLHSTINYNSLINNPVGIQTNIGAANTAAYFYKGRIYQSQIYNRALSASEVAQNYNATKGRFGLV